MPAADSLAGAAIHSHRTRSVPAFCGCPRGDCSKLVERDRVLPQQGQQLWGYAGELHAPLDRERRSGKQRGDVIDASPFLGQNPVCAQHVERIESFALGVLDQGNGEGCAFTDDPHRDRVVGGDVFLFEQKVERSLAAARRTRHICVARRAILLSRVRRGFSADPWP
jgi:hypothetical protein